MTQDKAMPERIYARFDTHEGSWLSEAAGYLGECQYTRSDLVAAEIAEVRENGLKLHELHCEVDAEMKAEIDRLQRCVVKLFEDPGGDLSKEHADTIKAAQEA